jgi:acyl-CoA synthetase (NDP forming)
MFQQAGVVRAETIHQMFDVAALLAHQPLPAGRRVAVVGNSDSLGVLAADACLEAGLAVVGDPVDLGTEATAAEYARALGQVFADPDVDSVVAVFIPPLETADEDVAQVLAAQAHGSAKTVVSTFLGMRGVPAQLAAPGGAGSVPSYPTPEDAVRALALAVSYAEWRARPAGTPVRPDGVDLPRAHGLVGSVLQEAPDGRDLRDDETAELLACVGVAVEPVRAVSGVDEAVAAAAELGYPVALKSRAPHLQHRAELGGVRLGLADEEDLRTAWASLAATVGPSDLVVQRMVPPGVACVAGSTEDPLFGPVVWFGVGGVASELFDDTAYRAAPLTDVDAAEMVRTVRAAPLLLGHRGSAPVDLAALEDLLLRVSTLTDALPEVAELELQPVLAAAAGRTVLAASARLSPPLVRVDRGPRALSG